jgi:alkaline phosphatase
MGTNTWAATRLLTVGPDGRLAWDGMRAAPYIGPMLDSLTASSNGGGTTHAWGVRARTDSFGMVEGVRIPRSRSGADVPLMLEAKRRGKAIGLVNTASITDAGTGTQIAVVESRSNDEGIAVQLLAAEPDLLLGGGEGWFLPKGVQGRHGEGLRTDGRNLIEEARAKGYVIVLDADELAALPANAPRVLGLFAHENTFNEGTEEALAAAGLPAFQPQAPRYDVMVAAAIKHLSKSRNGYYLMAEEEATDNMGGDNNASATLEAAAGADRAVKLALEAQKRNPRLSVVVASDSDCGGLQPIDDDFVEGTPLPANFENGSPLDGPTGTGSLPFMAAPNAQGKRLPFAVAWATDGDASGGGTVRVTGPAAKAMPPTMDSTDIFAVLYAGLFNKTVK